MKNYVIYLRVSTQKQGAQGLGIDAQRKMCNDFAERNGGMVVNEFMDVESGTHRDRKGLWQAIEYCKKNSCGLVIAKLDRLARDVEFTFKVMNTGIDIHFTDMPVLNSMILGVFAAVAQYEREMTATRTKSALKALKDRGDKQLGAANEKYRQSYESKSDEERAEENAKRGYTKNRRYIENRDTQAFVKVLRNVFPDACTGEPSAWNWRLINAKSENVNKMICLMQDYKDMDGEGRIFCKWDLNADYFDLQKKIAAKQYAIRKAYETYAKYNKTATL